MASGGRWVTGAALALAGAMTLFAGCRDWSVTWAERDSGAGDVPPGADRAVSDAGGDAPVVDDGPRDAPVVHDGPRDGPLVQHDGPQDGPLVQHDGPQDGAGQQDGGPHDAAADAGPCSDPALPKVPRFGTPVWLEVNDTYENFGPTITADGLELFFTSYRTSTSYDLYTATRADTTVQFGGALYVGALSSFSTDRHPTIRGDGLLIIFSSDRVGGFGSFDFWQSTRPSRQDPWTTPTHVSALSSPDVEFNPSMTPDGQIVVISRAPLSGDSSLWESRWSGSSWTPPAKIAELDTARADEAPALFPDGRTLVFSSDRDSGTGGEGHLYVARRRDLSSPFECVEAITDLWEDGTADSDPFVTADEKELYFASQRYGGWDLFKSLIWMPP